MHLENNCNKKGDPFSIAIIGSRGYPHVYSGYETLVKHLAEALVAKGINVRVYCHAPLFKSRPKQVNGVNLVYVPTLSSKALAQPIQSFLSFMHLITKRVDAVLVVNVSNGPFGVITKILGIPTLINVDGLEWLRPKWKGLGAKYFKWGAKMATKWMDRLVTDAEAMRQVYLEQFNKDSVVIAYGAETNQGANQNLLASFGLNTEEYYLIVGRMIPDNNADIIIEGFIRTNSTKKIVIVGDVPYQDTYADKIKSIKDPRLVFTGYIKDPFLLASLYAYCFAYFHGHEFGGTNPTLLKAMANGCAIAALDTVFSREVLQDEVYGMYFNKNAVSITNWIQWAETHPHILREKRASVKEGLSEKYSWETVVNQYLYHLKDIYALEAEAI
jgi:glycosyltransferase involved in cell wall biosynthesis